jgi:nucleoside-diphosphate-sugar epimerase
VGSVEYLHGTVEAELTALQHNLLIDLNVFRACVAKGIRVLIYASSVSVYPIDLQQHSGVVLAEDDLHYFNPEGGYGWAKLIGEIQLQWLRNLRIGIARIFNVFGEGEKPDESAHVVPAIMRKVIVAPRGEFQIWGDGSQTRDLLYVEDAIDALIKLEKAAAFPPVVVNVGSGNSISVRDLVQKVIIVSGKGVHPQYDSAKPVGPRSRTADIKRAKSLLRWEPKVGLDEGLSRTYRWVAAQLANS